MIDPATTAAVANAAAASWSRCPDHGVDPPPNNNNSSTCVGHSSIVVAVKPKDGDGCCNAYSQSSSLNLCCCWNPVACRIWMHHWRTKKENDYCSESPFSQQYSNYILIMEEEDEESPNLSCAIVNPVLMESGASFAEQHHRPESGKEQIGSNRDQQQHRTSVSRKRIGDYDELSVLFSSAQRVQHSAPAYNILPCKS